MAVKRDLLVDKLYDKKFYNTVFISKADEEKATDEHIEALVELLCDPRYKSSKQEVYNFMKKEAKAVDLLMKGIVQAKGDKKVLVSAAWESGVDTTRFLPLFAELIIRDDFEVAIESLTVIEQMTGEVTPQQATELIGKVKEHYAAQSNSPKGPLLMDLVDLLSRWL